MIGDEGQRRADVGGVVPKQEPTNAGKQRQVPVERTRRVGVEGGEHPLRRWLLGPGWGGHLRAPVPPNRSLESWLAACSESRDSDRLGWE